MEWLIDLIVHLDRHLASLIEFCGIWTYVVMFLVIFCETGLVVTPFLPGDSLLFALGALAGSGHLNLMVLLVSLIVAAILGDSVNYACGAWLGPRIFRGEKVRFLNRRHLETTHEFFEKYGGMTIILARFIPIVRTFAPFVAGMGQMSYPRFMTYNVVGGIVWVVLFLLLGYFVGQQEWVKNNYTWVILGIVVLSVVPAVVTYLRERASARKKKASAAAD